MKVIWDEKIIGIKQQTKTNSFPFPTWKDELELKVGDDILFLGEVEEGWWRGKLRGKVSLPYSFSMRTWPKLLIATLGRSLPVKLCNRTRCSSREGSGACAQTCRHTRTSTGIATKTCQRTCSGTFPLRSDSARRARIERGRDSDGSLQGMWRQGLVERKT